MFCFVNWKDLGLLGKYNGKDSLGGAIANVNKLKFLPARLIICTHFFSFFFCIRAVQPTTFMS